MHNSRPAANRTIRQDDTIIPVQYVNESFSHLYTKYRDVHPEDKISPSTFRKYTNKRFKKAQKETDLCEACENGKLSKLRLSQLTSQIGCDCELGLQTYWDNKVLCPHLLTIALETLEKLCTLHKEVAE